MSCDEAVLAPMTVCLNCGGLALYQPMAGGDWGVDAGPIVSMQFRKEAVDYLATVLNATDRAQMAQKLGSERVRLVSGLNRELADALARRIGIQQTNAESVQGSPKRTGLSGAFRYGLPLIAVAGGVAIEMLIAPVGLIAGGIGAVALGAMNASRRKVTLGEAPVTPVAPAAIANVPERLLSAWNTLETDAKPHLRTIIHFGMKNLVTLMDDDNILAISAGHEQGELFQATAQMIEAAVVQVEQCGSINNLAMQAKAAEALEIQITELTTALEAGQTNEMNQIKLIDGIRAMTDHLKNDT